MNEHLYRLNTEGNEQLSPEDAEAIEAIFEQALIAITDWHANGLRCPFCEDGEVYEHPTGVCHCLDCDTTWIGDGDFQRLTESEEARAARLAGEYQAAHSERLFGER